MFTTNKKTTELSFFFSVLCHSSSRWMGCVVSELFLCDSRWAHPIWNGFRCSAHCLTWSSSFHDMQERIEKVLYTLRWHIVRSSFSTFDDSVHLFLFSSFRTDVTHQFNHRRTLTLIPKVSVLCGSFFFTLMPRSHCCLWFFFCAQPYVQVCPLQ